MIREIEGKVVKGLGGLYEVRYEENGKIERISCRAKGNLKRDEEKVLIGDRVKVMIDTDTPDGIVISKVLPRSNSLIRPPMANLDYLFIVMAAKKPSPVIETVDKLISIAVHNRIRPVIVVTKGDLSSDAAEEYASLYRSVGIDSFTTSSESGEGISALSEYIEAHLSGGATAAFAGASGVGKSTLMNALFPSLSLATSEVSRKIERGRHTTRHVEIFDIGDAGQCGFLADTPGFSLIDFERFDFFGIDDLLPTFSELLPYVDRCRYSDCSHTREAASECAVAAAAERGEIPASRLESYRNIYGILKAKNTYE
ncbi:MAG: ribosome small subunit-dependent GTPase A [Clostridia bacterium]|nr:ribosome small subunit-dependent GTPase A [Clostridia bacterium]